jgi:hypothetical protein
MRRIRHEKRRKEKKEEEKRRIVDEIKKIQAEQKE